MKRTIFFIFHGRFPSERASALFAAHDADSFAQAGEDIIFLAPRTRATRRTKGNVQEYFHLKNNFRIIYLPAIDFFRLPILGRIAFPLSFFTFSLSIFFYLLFKSRSTDIIYSNEILPLFSASLIRKNTFYEMHDFPKNPRGIFFFFVRRICGVITHNEWKKEKLITTLSLDPNSILMERNAVDTELFQSSLSKRQAREKLNIPAQLSFVAVYTGHLYGWKGAHVFAEAANYLPNVLCVFVGGRAQDDLPEFKKIFGSVSNIYITGQRPHHEIPLWQKAADVLVLPNSGKKILSTHYTSPMKLFEYMASERPIVATNLPSIKEITKDGGALLVTADDPKALAAGIQQVLDDEDLSKKLAARALVLVGEHTWQKRAGRILSFVNQKAIVE